MYTQLAPNDGRWPISKPGGAGYVVCLQEVLINAELECNHGTKKTKIFSAASSQRHPLFKLGSRPF